MNRMMIAPLAMLALAGCNQGNVTLTNASPEEVAKAVKDAGGTTMKPGNWETTVEIVEASIAGMPEMKGDMLKNRPDRIQKHQYCMTPEEAANPGGGLFTGDTKHECKVEKFTMRGGNIQQTISCPGPDGKPGMVMSTSGTYTADTMKGTADMEMAGVGMKMKVNLTSQRTGACKGGATPAAGETKS